MKYRSNKILVLLLTSAMLFALYSCKSKKQALGTYAPVVEKMNAQLFSDILSNSFEYSTFSSKLNLNISSGKSSISSKANIRIIKDNTIQLSIQPLFGVEMFRVHITPDTFILLDRMNKQYVQESISDLKKRYPVGFDFETLQALFSNNIFVSGKQNIEISDFNRFQIQKASNTHYLLKAKDELSDINYSFTVDGNDKVGVSYLIEPEKKYSLQWKYSNFEMVEDKLFPSKMDVSVETPSRKMAVDIDFSDIKKDEQFTLSMNIPAGYSKKRFDEVLRILISI